MSTHSSLHLDRLDIERSPGIRDRYHLDRLSGGINIIYGPNAAGKTTTGQFLQALLWPGADRLANAFRGSALAWIDGEKLRVDLTDGRAAWWRGVERISPPINDDANQADRYRLALHDLLLADNAGFALQIARESAGGYDLTLAAKQLKYFSQPRGSSQLRDRFNQAINTTREARAFHRSIRDLEEELGRLQERVATRGDLNREVVAIQAALTFIATRQAYQLARSEAEAFPEGMKPLRDDDRDRVNQLRAERETLERRQAEQTTIMTEAEAAIAASGLANVTLPDRFVEELASRCQAVDESERALAQIHAEISRLQGERDEARKAIDPAINDETLERLDPDLLRQLASIAGSRDLLIAQASSYQELIGSLEDLSPPGNFAPLIRAVQLLEQWLRQADQRTPTARYLQAAGLASALLAGLEGALLGYKLNPGYYLLAALGLVLLLLLVIWHSMDRGLGAIESEFRALDIEQPSSWDGPEVRGLLGRLQDDLDEVEEQARRSQRWGHLPEKYKSTTDELAALEKEWMALLAELGADPESNAQLLRLLLDNLSGWQRASRALAGATSRLEEESRNCQTMLNRINRSLARFGYPPAFDGITARNNLARFDARLRSLHEAQTRSAHAQEMLETHIAPARDKSLQQEAEIFERLGVALGDDDALDELVRHAGEFRAAQEKLRQAEWAMQEAERKVPPGSDLPERGVESLSSRLEEIQTELIELDSAGERIIKIEERIGAAKEVHDLELALGQEDDARQLLRRNRHEVAAIRTGRTLVDFLQERTRDQDRPAVFHRAQARFAEITQGRYTLRLGFGKEPVFTATDTISGREHALDELSSATRLQLLLAVRLAFVEESEQGPRLPLVFDELLANSDEARSEAIIEAAIAICRTGRQIFYLTAQHDEVNKWLDYLASCPDVEFRHINLAEVRQLADRERLPAVRPLRERRPLVPAPQSEDREAYRRQINVAGIDPWKDAGSLHLWYLIPQLDRLHALLRHSVPTWGQLSTLADRAPNALPIDSGTLAVARDRAFALEAATRAWRVGRTRPVDREALRESGAVSERFLDAVAELASDCHGDGAALIPALQAGQVPQFRQEKIERLEAYLIANQYLDRRATLPESDLRLAAIDAAPTLSLETIDELLGYLPAEGDPAPITQFEPKTEVDTVAMIMPE